MLADVGDRGARCGPPDCRRDGLNWRSPRSVLLADNDASLTTLRKLHELGAHIAMDDFGTGYSSLSYLRSFPFDKIKIDKVFVRDLETKADSRAIVRAIIGLGHSLGMQILAEGVETKEQLERLRAEGCAEAQGYLYSEPRPAADCSSCWRAWRRRRWSRHKGKGQGLCPRRAGFASGPQLSRSRGLACGRVRGRALLSRSCCRRSAAAGMASARSPRTRKPTRSTGSPPTRRAHVVGEELGRIEGRDRTGRARRGLVGGVGLAAVGGRRGIGHREQVPAAAASCACAIASWRWFADLAGGHVGGQGCQYTP